MSCSLSAVRHVASKDSHNVHVFNIEKETLERKLGKEMANYPE